MSEMIERAGRELQDAWDASPTLPPLVFTPEESAALVRAVVAAMREPSPAMVRAGCGEIIQRDMDANNIIEQVQDCWRTMIDAALTAPSSPAPADPHDPAGKTENPAPR